jgi:hypothetical protein
MEVKRKQPEIVAKIQKKFDTDKEYNSKGFMVVNSVLDLDDYYVVSMVPKNMSKDDFMVDGLFKLDKKLTKIEGFSLDMGREKYLKALKSPIYIRIKPN